MCAAAPVSSVFIGGRAVAGLGAAGLLQGALAIVTFIAPLEKRQLYIGLIISVFGISACGGPILRGRTVRKGELEMVFLDVSYSCFDEADENCWRCGSQ